MPALCPKCQAELPPAPAGAAARCAACGTTVESASFPRLTTPPPPAPAFLSSPPPPPLAMTVAPPPAPPEEEWPVEGPPDSSPTDMLVAATLALVLLGGLAAGGLLWYRARVAAAAAAAAQAAAADEAAAAAAAEDTATVAPAPMAPTLGPPALTVPAPERPRPAELIGTWDLRHDDGLNCHVTFGGDGGVAVIAEPQDQPPRTVMRGRWFVTGQADAEYQIELGRQAGAMGNRQLTIVLTAPDAFTVVRSVQQGVVNPRIERYVRRPSP